MECPEEFSFITLSIMWLIHFLSWHWPVQNSGHICGLQYLNFENAFYFLFLFFLFCFFEGGGSIPPAHGSSQARGQIRPTAAGLHHSHSNKGSEPRMQPIPQLMATLDPQPTHQARPGTEPTFLRILVRFISTAPQQELPEHAFF